MKERVSIQWAKKYCIYLYLIIPFVVATISGDNVFLAVAALVGSERNGKNLSYVESVSLIQAVHWIPPSSHLPLVFHACGEYHHQMIALHLCESLLAMVVLVEEKAWASFHFYNFLWNTHLAVFLEEVTDSFLEIPPLPPSNGAFFFLLPPTRR